MTKQNSLQMFDTPKGKSTTFVSKNVLFVSFWARLIEKTGLKTAV